MALWHRLCHEPILRGYYLILPRRGVSTKGARLRRGTALHCPRHHSAEEQEVRRQDGFTRGIRQLWFVAAQLAALLLVLCRLWRVGQRDRTAVRHFQSNRERYVARWRKARGPDRQCQSHRLDSFASAVTAHTFAVL